MTREGMASAGSRSIEGFQFNKHIFPLKKARIAGYNFVDYQGKLEWKHHTFYCFWGDTEIKKYVDSNSEHLSNYILNKGEFVYVSFKRSKGEKKLIFLYNVRSLFHSNFSDDLIFSYFSTSSPKEIFCRIRSIFLDMGIDLAIAKTQSQLASMLFRFTFLNKIIYAPPYPVRRMALRCAYGDLRQIYKVGVFKGHFRLYDAKSFYPQNCISVNTFPAGGDWRQCRNEEDFLGPKNKGGFAIVFFDSGVDYPFVGVKSKNKFTWGKSGYACLSLSEYKIYKEFCNLNFMQGWAYQKGNKALYDYQSYLLDLREKYKKDIMLYLYIKNLQNLIVGKLMQRGSRRPVSFIRSICSKYKMPFSMALNSILLNKREILFERIGALYSPEWYSLITAQGRSVQSQAVIRADPYTALTDHVLTDRALGKGFDIQGYNYRVKNEGSSLVVLSTGQAILDGKYPKVWASGYPGWRKKGIESLRQEFLKKLKKRLDNHNGTY